MWAAQHSIPSASADDFRTCLLLVDVQNTFCIPGYELFVGGRSGNGAVEDNVRLCASSFIVTYHKSPQLLVRSIRIRRCRYFTKSSGLMMLVSIHFTATDADYAGRH